MANITATDIMPMEQYGAERRERARALSAIKRDRRVEVGPHATFYFENYDTMWHQIHEMLYIEKGGEDQIAGELAAYNPLIPQGRELVATFMIEISDPERRARILAGLGGIEETITLTVGGETITVIAEDDIDRTTAEGKASAIHFLHFPFTDAQVAAFSRPGAEIVLSIAHPGYRHMAIIPETVRAALASDFD
ncbi:MAG: DUF3501 family protein [Alphaproteobacteria bacterium]